MCIILYLGLHIDCGDELPFCFYLLGDGAQDFDGGYKWKVFSPHPGTFISFLPVKAIYNGKITTHVKTLHVLGMDIHAGLHSIQLGGCLLVLEYLIPSVQHQRKALGIDSLGKIYVMADVVIKETKGSRILFEICTHADIFLQIEFRNKISVS